MAWRSTRNVEEAVRATAASSCSLSCLQRPITILEVDRSFVAPLEDDPAARVLAGAVLRLAETLSLRVVAEGVETAGQADVLLTLGCETVQGYLFGRPGPLDALTVPGLVGQRA